MSKLPLNQIISQYNDLLDQLSGVSDPKTMKELGKKLKILSVKHDLAQTILKTENQINENNELLADIDPNDQDMKPMLESDNARLSEILTTKEEEILSLLVPEDPRDTTDILLEIRGGAGGDESSIFAGEILRAYSYLAEQIGCKLKIVDVSAGTVGGYKEVIAEVTGDSPYAWFKFEAGVHRVQRVPDTEKQGRIHTSTITVAIMPIIEKDNDFKLEAKDIEIVISTSQGAGGQSVNTTYSAVRMKHTPTGIEAQSQDERSQIQNRERCLTVLTSRVYDFLEQERLSKEKAARLSQVGSGDRSEKIRTYNFPQDRLTDHRYNHSWNQLQDVMNGKIYDILVDIRRMEGQRAVENLNNPENE